jgi:hypothetical protein
MPDIIEFLNRVSQRLGSNGFVPMDPALYQPVGFKFVTRRSGFEIAKFGMHDAVFVFAEIPGLDPVKFKGFADAAFNFANANKSVSLPNGFFMSVSCFAVAITANIDAQFSASIKETSPTNHFGGFELPVAYDLTTNSLSYYEKTQLWGAAYLAGFRKQVVDNLS